MNVTRVKKTLIKALPYIIIGLILTNFGEAWCLSEGSEAGEKILSFFSMVGVAFRNPAPSFHPMDILIGTLCGAALRLAVYVRGKNAKHFCHNEEYGSARWSA